MQIEYYSSIFYTSVSIVGNEKMDDHWKYPRSTPGPAYFALNNEALAWIWKVRDICGKSEHRMEGARLIHWHSGWKAKLLIRKLLIACLGFELLHSCLMLSLDAEFPSFEFFSMKLHAQKSLPLDPGQAFQGQPALRSNVTPTTSPPLHSPARNTPDPFFQSRVHAKSRCPDFLPNSALCLSLAAASRT